MDESWVAQFQDNEVWCFYLATALVALWEQFAPRKQLTESLRRRWFSNFGLLLVCSLLQRWLLPIVSVVFAMQIQDLGWGLFNLVQSPAWIVYLGSFLLLDFSFYLKHRISHYVPWLWRVHRLHHCDENFDITTSFRFHPLDIAYQIILGLLTVALVGPSPSAVAIYALIFAALSRLQHGNIYVPLSVERFLRLIIVSADMHRIHHSSLQRETDSNFGGLFPWFDRVLGTYIPDPVGGHENMTVGLKEFKGKYATNLGWMLLNPFLSSNTSETEQSTIETAETAN